MKNLHNSILFFFLLLFFFQQSNAKTSTEIDTNLIKKQFTEVGPLIKSDITAAKNLAFKIVQESRKINNVYYEAKGINSIGIIYFTTGDFDSSRVYYEQALQIANKNNITEIQRKAIGNLGLLYSRMGNYAKAIEMLFQSLKLCEEAKDSLGMASKFADIGSAYYYWGKIKKSIEYNNKALKIFTKYKNNQGQANVLNSMGSAYSDLKKTDSAKIFYNQSYNLKLKIGDKNGASNTLINISMLYSDNNQNNEALEFYKKALDIKKQIPDKEGMANIYINIGNIYERQKKYPEGLNYLKKGFDLASEINSKLLIKTAAMNMSDIYFILGNYKLAYEYNKIFFETKIKLSDDNIAAKITEIETRYKTEKKEIENAKLLKENEVKELRITQTEQSKKMQFLIFSIFCALLIFTAIFIFYRNRQKQKSELLKEQVRQEKIRFKAIIDSEEKERIRIAKELHDGLGQLLSSAKLNISSLEGSVPENDEYLLQNSSNIIDEAVKEVRSISHNMMPTALMNYGLIEAIEEQVRRINSTKKITINLIKNNFFLKIEKETEIAIYRIFQEIVNNMLKHSNASVIDISLENKDTTIFLSIIDNGTGFDTSKIKESKGIGWQNIFSRVSMINGKIEINSQIEKGTEVKLIF